MVHEGNRSLFADSIYYSDDKKYILVISSDHTIRILDTESGKCVNSFELTMDIIDGFWLSSVTGNYIISGEEAGKTGSLILDKNMEIVCETDYIANEDGDNFFMVNSELEYYKVPYIDQKELIRIADNYLGDYEPADIIKQKYGTN